MRTHGQREHGLFSTLGRARVYDAVQDVLGAGRVRSTIARQLGASPARPLRVLDLGCGTARLLEHLRDCEYVGVDANPRYIEAATRAYGGRGRFLCADARDGALETEAPFDVALMLGFLHHVDDESARALFARVASHLSPQGRLLTLDGAHVADNDRITRLLLAWDRGLHVRTPAEYGRLAEHGFERVTVHVRRDLLRVPYTHAIVECSSPRVTT